VVVEKNKDGIYWIDVGYVAQTTTTKVVLSYKHDQYEWLLKEEFLKRESSQKIKHFLMKL